MVKKKKRVFTQTVMEEVTANIVKLAQRQLRAHIRPEFTLQDVIELRVQPSDRDDAAAGWRLAKRFVGQQNCYARINSGSLPNNVVLGLRWDPDHPRAFVPPDYLNYARVALNDALPELVTKVDDLMKTWLDIGMKWGLVRDVVDWLDDLCGSEPGQIRYLLPGIMPILRMSEADACRAAVLKLQQAKLKFGINVDAENSRTNTEMLQYVNETIAEGLLYPKDGRTVSGEITCWMTAPTARHPQWHRIVSPILDL